MICVLELRANEFVVSSECRITMGIRTMPWSEWIELDSTYSHWQRVRKFRVRTRGHDAVRVLPAREDESVKVQGGAWAGVLSCWIGRVESFLMCCSKGARV